MKTTNTLCALTLATSTVLLAACGGGDESTAPAPLSVNADAAVTSTIASGFKLAQGQSLTLSGLTGTDKAGNAYGMTITQSGVVGAPVVGGDSLSRQTISLTRNGVAATTSTRETYFTTNPYKPKRYVGGSGQIRIYESVASLPTAAPVGAKGTLNNYVMYPSSTVNIPVGEGTTTWSIEPDTASTAFVCLTHNSTTLLPETFCYRVDASGAVTGAKATISINDELVSFK